MRAHRHTERMTTPASLRQCISQMHGYTLSAVLASAADLQSSPRGNIKRPRSAPACSMAARISLSISFSRAISPETACDTLITVARSRSSTGATIVLVDPDQAARLPL